MADKPLMLGFFGARGTGKTVGAKRHLMTARPARLLVWDFKHDPGLADVGRPVASLPELLRAMCAQRWQLRYLVDHDQDMVAQFDKFCRAAWLAGDLTLFVDEVPEVTKPGKAPPAWRKLVNVGREYTRADGAVVGITIIGNGQRTREVDKSFMANLDVLRVGRMGHDDDAKAMAAAIGCDWRELMSLPDLEFFERRAGSVAPTRGRITFTKKKSAGQGGA